MKYKIINEFVNNDIIIMSWGASDFLFSESTLSFNVSGFKYSGRINIAWVNNDFKISFLDIGLIYENISIKNIIKEIDETIESGEFYEETLRDWINLF